MQKQQQQIREEMKALKARMEELKSQVPTLKAQDKLTVKITEKGGISVYGLGRFPVNLYASQAVRLGKLLASQEFQEFLQANAEKLAKKSE